LVGHYQPRTITEIMSLHLLMCVCLGVLVKEVTSETVISALEVPEEQTKFDAHRIVGGTDAEPMEFPFAVNMQIITSSGKKFLCGGTVLTPKYILTAVHCIKYDGMKTVQVTAGSFDRGAKKNDQIQKSYVVNTIIENYNATVMANDVAILQLAKPLKYNDAIQSICLASGNEKYENKNATVIGWGKTTQDGKTSGKLQKLNVEVPSNQECIDKGANSVTDSNICIIVRNNTAGVCFGDSGGPLVVKKPDDSFVQIGVASYVIATCGTQNLPSVYARVSSFVDWIEKVVGESVRCKN